MEFLFGSILFAAAAGAAPVIIHLIMRTKPRLVDFPALRFVKKNHRANLSKLKLKHLILLAMRVLALVALAFLFAWPLVPAWSNTASRSLPTTAVIVIDDTASMGYRVGNVSLLSRGRELVRQLMIDQPDGSSFAVLTVSNPSARTDFVEPQLAGQMMEEVEPTASAAPVAEALQRAGALLTKARGPRKEIYLVTDLTQRAWRDGSGLEPGLAPAGQTPDDPRQDAAPDVIVLHPSGWEGANIALTEPRLSATRIPVGATLNVETALACTNLGGTHHVTLATGGKTVARQTVDAAAGAVVPAGDLATTPDTQGLLQGTVALDSDDALEADNVRYFTVTVGPPANVLFVRDQTTVGRRDLTSLVMASAVAPAGGSSAWVKRQTITNDRLSAKSLEDVAVVLVTNVASLGAQQWQALNAYVHRGGHLWVVVGPLLDRSAWATPEAQRLMPAALGALQSPAAPVGWDKDHSGHPMLAPFRDEANAPLTDIRCRRRFAIESVAPGAVTVAAYADGPAAILLRSVGRGSVLLWNFSPDDAFSNLAPLPQLPILARQTLEQLLAGTRIPAAYTWGRTVTVPFPINMPAALVSVRRPGLTQWQPVPAAPNTRRLELPADRVGQWTVRFTQDGREHLAGFSVNVDAAESDLTQATAQDVETLFGPGAVQVVSSSQEVARRSRDTNEALELLPVILLIVLVLTTGEAYFANRFYKPGEKVELE